ncbi:molybdopterin-guanine dinucleotide biosynthesis protein B [Paenibacillus cisolokensis]|uniref:molybdopterin-guanine dinucleotide biosynthesis protein B n=1 Tax=Paenibacillus cisolokensis TaxID=1658519 RepID=UPI003D2CA618
MKVVRVVQLCGYKNSGKTTLLAAVIRQLKARGVRLAVIKHDAHQFEMDHPGTDTDRFREAGADAVAITSPGRTAVLMEAETPLETLIGAFRDVDLVLVEGFKQAAYPKLVLLRDEADAGLLQLQGIMGIVVPKEMIKPQKMTEEPGRGQTVGSDLPAPVIPRDDVDAIVALILSSEAQ